MDNDGSVIVCQLLFTFQISFNSSPSHPHPQREPVICAARAGRGKECQELMIPIIRQKPLFIHHFGSCDPGRPTQATPQTRGGMLHDFTFVLTQSDGEIFKYYLWHDAMVECAKIVIAHWSPGTSYVFIFIEESSRGVIMQTSGYHSRSSHPPQIFMNADTSTRMMKRWSSENSLCNLIRHCPWSVPVITHPLINSTFLTGPDVEKRPDTRSWGEERRPPRRDAESNDPEVRLVRT